MDEELYKWGALNYHFLYLSIPLLHEVDNNNQYKYKYLQILCKLSDDRFLIDMTFFIIIYFEIFFLSPSLCIRSWKSDRLVLTISLQVSSVKNKNKHKNYERQEFLGHNTAHFNPKNHIPDLVEI